MNQRVEQLITIGFFLPMMIASLLITADLFLKSIKKAVKRKEVQFFLITILIFTYLYFVLSFSMNLVGFVTYHYAFAIFFYYYFNRKIGEILIIATSVMVWFYLFLVDLPNREHMVYLILFSVVLLIVMTFLDKINVIADKTKFYLIYIITMVASPKSAMMVYHKVEYEWYQLVLVLLGSFVLMWGFSWLHQLIEKEEKEVIDELLSSRRDSLTGAYNFYSFNKDLVIYNQIPMNRSIAMIDIDHFKAFNDEHGHLAGNDLLREFAQLMEAYLGQTVGSNHYKLYRYGGEEFCIIFEDISIAFIKETLESLRVQIYHHAFNLSNKHVSGISFSAGIENCQEEQGSLLDALHLADLALYQAKNNGRNQVRIYSDR
ncbi:MAG TPA: GGDEF domain-containing protein [Candidatus Jeotgalibaca merdavium]|uniref:GGDEF domain-containing protein n=1 Tax=Candidatus Jeotgalibaca merdavium TaxID=2838627 RepID=A0A9D2I1Y3_9LACT|nr:GGDEF domain-containing protein [Candidatus Jeotgalibaca merdavium]